MMILNPGIGLCTPPVGTSLIVGCGIAWIRMGRTLRQLVQDTAAIFAPQVELGAVVCAMSSLLDVGRLTWCVSARWPELRNLDLGTALAEFDCPVWLIRNLDAELAGLRLQENHGADETALLLHWGHGIGAAYAAGGDVVNRSRGRFCEISHWSLGNGRGLRRNCGNTDCLKTALPSGRSGPRCWPSFPTCRSAKPPSPHILPGSTCACRRSSRGRCPKCCA